MLAGLQSTAFMVCLLLFRVGGVQSSVQLSVGFRVYSVQYQFSVCSVQGVYCSVGHSPSVYSSVSAVFRALAVHHESVMSCSCPVQIPHSEGPLPLHSS